MYIDPFWAGVLSTIFAEAVAFVALAIFSVHKQANKNNDEK